MQVEDYLNIRNTARELASKILNYNTDSKNAMIYAGKLLGFWNGDSMVFDSDEESDVLMDFLIYEKNKLGQRLIDLFYDSDIELTDIEEDILEGQVEYHASLFEILQTNQTNYTLVLRDLLSVDKPEFTLMDMGLSQTGNQGLLLYTRLIPILEINMTSGVSFGFESNKKEQLLDDISLEQFKKRRKLDSTDLFLLTHKKRKLYGREIFKIET